MVAPPTRLLWHGELVRRKWTYGSARRPGRSPLTADVRELILRLARENPRWGCVRISGELWQLEIRVGATTVRMRLRRAVSVPTTRPQLGGVPPRPGERDRRMRLLHRGETVWLRTLYVLAFIELHSRRVFVSPATADPTAPWVTQQARNVAMDFEDRASPVRFLIHDRDAMFADSFDEVFHACGADVILSPIRAPTANAVAERWVRTVRSECLDWILVRSRRHLDHVLRTYAAHYNRRRPHRSLDLGVPAGEEEAGEAALLTPSEIRRRNVLGGLIHEHYGAAA